MNGPHTGKENLASLLKTFRPSRRRVLQGGAAGLALSQVAHASGSGSAPTGLSKELFLMDRITFGINGDMHTEYVARGYSGFLDWQLDPGGVGHDLAHQAQVLSDLDAIEYIRPNYADQGGLAGGPNPFRVGVMRGKTPFEVFPNFPDTNAGTFCSLLMITDVVHQGVHSRYQLLQVMNDFWMNVFSMYALQKSLWLFLPQTLDKDIRPRALGKFGDLLLAVARSHAMMIYLDQAQSVKAEPNENFARELLELHTVGEGNFSETDVVETAKILTGWSIHAPAAPLTAITYEHIVEIVGPAPASSSPNTLKAANIGSAVYLKDEHVLGSKTVLGKQYGSNAVPVPLPPDFGIDEGEQLIQDLALHPSTADTLVRRLIKWLLFDDEPAPALLTRVKNAYLGTGGDIASTLRELFNEACLAEIAPGPEAKIRRPLNKLIWTMRTSQLELDHGTTVFPDWFRMLLTTGQLPTAWPSPDGHPAENAHWMDGLHGRLDMVDRIAFEDETAIPYTDAQLIAFFANKPVSKYANRLNLYFFLLQLPPAELSLLDSYIVGLSSTVTGVPLMREAISMAGSLPSAQFLH